MTFLELCKRLRSEASMSGTGPASVVSQTGEALRLVEWILTAYDDIQNLRSDWKFLQDDFSFSTVASQQSYTPTEAGVSDLATWKKTEWGDVRCYLTTADESRIEYMDWSDFKNLYLFGTARDLTRRPSIFSVKPDNSIIFYPKPDTIYTINGEYFKRAQTMTANADEPIFPVQYHLAIVWRALMFYAAEYAADEKYTHGQNEYRKMIRKLEIDQTPQMGWGAPLA